MTFITHAVFTGLAILLMIAAVVVGVSIYSDLPRVYRSWSTQRCVQVWAPEPVRYDCRHLPTRYELVWVE